MKSSQSCQNDRGGREWNMCLCRRIFSVVLNVTESDGALSRHSILLLMTDSQAKPQVCYAETVVPPFGMIIRGDSYLLRTSKAE